MAELSSALFPIGVLFVALGFAAYVGHAVMLANGRRTVSVTAPQLSRQPAYAGVVTGSFVTAQAQALERVLLAMHESPDGHVVLDQAFHCERFEAAPRLGYRALYRVALASL